MLEAGVSFVTLGVFSWSWLEPAKGEYDFAWLDEAMDLLHDNGIAVDLATATATPPPWLSVAHPEILPVDRDGHTLWPGSRQTWCPSSPVYRDACPCPDHPAGPALPRPPRPGPVARLQRVRLPQPAVLLRHLRGRLPPLAAWPLRHRGRPQRRLGHRVLEPALHRLGAGPPAAAHDHLREPDAPAGLRAVRLRHPARLLPRGEGGPERALPRGPGDDELHDAHPLPPPRLPPVGARAGRRSAPTTTSSTASSTPGPSCPSVATSPGASPAAGRGC